MVILDQNGTGSPLQSLSVDPGLTLTRGHVVGEEASRARPRDPEGERTRARDEAALPVAVLAVPGRLTEPVRLGRHRLVHDRLGELPRLPPRVHEPVLDARDGKRRLRRPHVCYAVHRGHCPSPEPVLRQFRF